MIALLIVAGLFALVVLGMILRDPMRGDFTNSGRTPRSVREARQTRSTTWKTTNPGRRSVDGRKL